MPATSHPATFDGTLSPSLSVTDPMAGATRTERRRAALAEIAQESFAATSCEALYLRAAHLAAQALGIEYAAAAYCEDGWIFTRLQSTQAASETWSQVHHGILPQDPSKSVWASAISQRRTVALPIVAGDDRLDALELRQAGAVGGAIAPVVAGLTPRGAIGVWSVCEIGLSDEDLAFLDSAAIVLASATARRDAERALAEQSRILAEVEHLEGLVAVLSPAGHVEMVNESCRRLTGFNDDELRGRYFWQSLLADNQAVEVQDALDRLRHGEAAMRIVAPLRTRGKPRRQIEWTFTIVQHQDGRARAIVAHGVESQTPPDQGAAAALHQKQQAVLSRLEQCLRAGRLPSRDLLNEMLELRQLEQQTPLHGRERRARLRRPYPYVQQIAPWNGRRLPRSRAFFDVRCRDISSGGFSFFLERKPPFDQLIAALGADHPKVHVAAEVRHVTPFDVEGPTAFLVGCEFLARVEY